MTLHWTCGSRRTAGGGGKPTPTSLISQTLGVLDEASADAIRAEGERVTGERPWPTGSENWRPPSGWEPLSLPHDWDAA